MGNNQGKPVVFTDDVNLNHFRLLRVVGKGAFGKVRIVERKDTGLTFALKYIRKDEIVRSESVRNIIRERRMLEHLNHPFICNLRYSFQDIEYMYIVVDLMTGGDLRFHISRKTFTEEAVRFWIGELGCALRYIHKKGIIHRDVKPDNVLLDSEGHVHLADFNVASDFVPGKLLTSKSGTLAYLAPEVYAGTGYSSGVDWWSLGVLFYECIYSKRPFDGSTQSGLGASISKANPSFPVTQPPVSMSCMHAISSALEPNPAKRMGSESWVSFIDNPFFRPLDFEALERKEIEPVFVPSSEKTNFDATYDLEELLLEEAPLEARARRQKPRDALKDDATEKEIREEELFRMIETMFEPFDYTAASYDGFPTTEGQPQSTTINKEQSLQTDPRNIPVDIQKPRKAGNSRPASPSQTTLAKSSASSADGSPPIPTGPLPLPLPIGLRSHRGGISQPTSAPTPPRIDRRPTSRSRISSRTVSGGGGSSSRNNTTSGSALGETSNLSDLAQKDTNLPSDAKDKPNAVLGFLSRKKGRSHSPKPQERGILGKEGARVVISP